MLIATHMTPNCLSDIYILAFVCLQVVEEMVKEQGRRVYSIYKSYYSTIFTLQHQHCSASDMV